MKSNTQKGTEFENAVAALLACKYEDVKQQVHLKGIDADIVLSHKTNPRRTKRVAVECKDWEGGCTKEDLKDILRSYEAAIDSSDIEELWVVTRKTPSATVREYSDGKKGLELFSLAEIENDIINFGGYLSHLIDDYDTDPLYSYYLLPHLVDSSISLHSFVTTWLADGPKEPIAIWAGYGMGKTSYARYLAAFLAREHATDPAKPIPLLISLGELYTSPNLSSLFRYNFEDRFGVKNYNHRAFEVMNGYKRFVIILDGFDEMKHAMSRAEFDDFTKQILALTIQSPCLILLGRPGAINSDEEYAYLAAGKTRIGSYEIADQQARHFTNVRIAFFSAAECRTFLRRYLAKALNSTEESPDVLSRVSHAESFHLDDIVKRPVQVKMLADILTSPANIQKVRISSRYELYDAFVDGCIRREMQKRSRRGISGDDRREFMRQLAWWLWCDKRTRTFTPYDVPRQLVRRFVPDNCIDERSACRELLIGSLAEERNVGSLLSEKNAGIFYFPHMSFSEFLVADYLATRELTTSDLLRLDTALTGEVLSFLSGVNGIDIGKIVFNKLAGFEGAVEVETLLRIVSNSKFLQNARISTVEYSFNAWEVLALSLSIFEKKVPHESHALLELLGQRTKNNEASIAAFFSLSWYISYYEDADPHAVACLVYSVLEILTLSEIVDAINNGHSYDLDYHRRYKKANEYQLSTAARLWRDHFEFAPSPTISEGMIVVRRKGLLNTVQRGLPKTFQPTTQRPGGISTPYVKYESLTREFYPAKAQRDALKLILARGHKIEFSGLG